jgi:Holliday junction DNA helicase RuvB
MNEPQANEVNDVSPSSLKHLVGQPGVVDQVRVALDAAFADNKKFDSGLLIGPPGLGKSALARVIADEMAVHFHETIGQSLKHSADLNGLLLAASNNDVIHIDEAHELRREFQTALYLALDKRQIIVPGGNKPQAIPLADFTLLLSTTDEFCLLQPLRDRLRLLLRFTFYEQEDLAVLLRQRSQALRWNVDDKVLAMIAERSRGTPRLALRLLQSCRRVCRAAGETTITTDHLERACQLEGLDALGLGPTEQQYLVALSEGASRLNVLASLLGVPTRTVSQVTEPFLIRAKLIAKDDQGRRQLTAEGRFHVQHLSTSRRGGVQ